MPATQVPNAGHPKHIGCEHRNFKNVFVSKAEEQMTRDCQNSKPFQSMEELNEQIPRYQTQPTKLYGPRNENQGAEREWRSLFWLYFIVKTFLTVFLDSQLGDSFKGGTQCNL